MVSKYRVAMYHLEVQFPNVAVTSYCLGSAVSKYRGYQVLFWKYRFHMLGLPGTTLEVHLPNVEVAGYCFGRECGEKTLKKLSTFLDFYYEALRIVLSTAEVQFPIGGMVRILDK